MPVRLAFFRRMDVTTFFVLLNLSRGKSTQSMRIFRKYKQLIISMVIMSLSGCLLIFYASSYIPVSTFTTTTLPITKEESVSSVPFVTRMTDRWKKSLDQMSAALINFTTKAEEEDEYVPSVLEYNLVNIFPENVSEVDQSSISSFLNNPSEFADAILKPLYKKLNLPTNNKVTESYGGQMYEILNRKDAEWTSSLYKWIQATPEQAAAMKSLPTSSVVGGYNPVNPLHIEEDPATWLIPSWKNVVINFKDGDDVKIDLYSNTQEILSMASVNTFYMDWQDLDTFKAYINRLWDGSHSYTTTISDIYYCDGCETLTPVNAMATEATASSISESEANVLQDNSSDGFNAPLMMLQEIPSSDGNAGPASEEATTSDEIALLAGTAIAATASDAVLAADIYPNSEIHLNAEGKFCSGHVDLTIDAKITGLSEKNNLFELDSAPPMVWTPYMKAYVYQVFAQDWSDHYGLSKMELGIGKPLTASEIAEYMSLLPLDLSLERRTVVAYALNSVGKIPYYYGGKPKTTGYKDNYFSSPVKPDHKGRILSGLDCSGWINWVYWSAVEEKLTSLGTSGLIHEGNGISREMLKPGDIIVKPGLNSHVVMFLSWAPDGSMICIHETGGSTSNVTVSTLNLDWPYYRAILD